MIALEGETREARWHPLLIRRTRRFRAATAEPAAVTGECLAPFLRDGDVVWFDRTLEPEDRDLVIVRAPFECLEDGAITHAFACKMLRLIAGEQWLTCAEGYVEADVCELIGVVTGWYRRAAWRRPTLASVRFREPRPWAVYAARAVREAERRRKYPGSYFAPGALEQFQSLPELGEVIAADRDTGGIARMEVKA